MANTLPELVYEMAVSNLARQEAKLDELRSRSGILLSAAAVAAAFLGGALLGEKSRGLLFWFGVALFVVALVLVLWVELPKKGLLLGPDVLTVVEDIEKDAFEDLDHAFMALARYYSEWSEENDKVLSRLLGFFTWAAVAVGGFLILWFVELWRYSNG
ncbi:MAG TPA: hypothetical protein ENH00_09195 [Actinobacteria bacterium]|nr:hypothetical protein [Actinomycetota bacterium]